MKNRNINLDSLLSLTKERFKKRYIFLIILAAATVFFSYFFKEPLSEKSFDPNTAKPQDVVNNIIEQEIKIDYNKPLCVDMKVGRHSDKLSSIYSIDVLYNDEVISSAEIDTSILAPEQLIRLVLPVKDDVKDSYFKVRITPSTSNISEENSLIIYSSNSNGNHKAINMIVNGEVSEDTIFTTVVYSRFSNFYLVCLGIIFVVGCIVILFFDLNKIHNSVCAVIIALGTVCVLLNPVLDTPDDHAHISRADLLTKGTFFISGEIEQYKVSNSTWDILDDAFTTLETTTLMDSPVDNEAVNVYGNYASTNLFVGYIPQAIGMLLGKIVGINSMVILMLGRLMNLIVYAFMVRFAIKITPKFKVPMSVIAVMPMSLFIASSFNPDCTTYWVAMLLIAYFLNIYDKENISMKDICIFTGLSILLGLVKLPYCIFAGLIIFIPKDKFDSNKTYYKSFLFVCLVAVVSLGWGLTSMFNSVASTFNTYFIDNNVDTKRQIVYILTQPIDFIRGFGRSALEMFPAYMEQLSTYGWLTYKLSKGLSLIYIVFLGSIILLYPTNYKIANKTKGGIILVSSAVYLVTCLILYLSWTPVGSTSIDGVQGRYFIPVLALISLISGGKDINGKDKEKMDIKVLSASIIFIVLFLISILNNYY